tara:strand:- start:423 stop:1406 length:984 start_codon:yes stop_codon:yes gene_type:complete
MGYVAGETIKDDEYNTFVASSSDPFGYNHIAGTGSGQYGLGQTELAQVSASDSNLIKAASWNSLLAGIENIANHTNDSVTARGQVTAGDPIKIKSAVATDLASIASSVAGGSVNATALSESSELQSSASGTRYSATHVVEQSVTFASGNNLRFFFNAGGKIRIKLTRTGNGGSSATSKDSSVDELITAMGNFDIGAQVSTRSGSGETLTTDGFANGVDDLGTSYTTIFKLTQASGTYTTMFIQGEAKVDNATYGSATVVTVRMTINDVDSGDATFQSSNLSSVDVNANFIGTTDFALHTVNPTTAQGLDPVYGIASSAEVSNNDTNG